MRTSLCAPPTTGSPTEAQAAPSRRPPGAAVAATTLAPRPPLP